VSTDAPRRRRVPLLLKLLYTAFMAVMVPVYWYNWGPTNFLYFCDLALFLTLAAIWTENPLLASIPAVGILVPQAVWVADFLTRAHITGMTDYMFDSNSSLFARGLSFFHGWLPFLLVYLVWRLGYDRRALVCWTLLAWAVMFVCYLWIPPPAPADPSAPQTAAPEVRERSWKWCGNDPPTNINYVYGFGDAAQTWMAPHLYFALLLVAFPLCLYLPAHLILRALFGSADRRAVLASGGRQPPGTGI
jgi:hypothetical protein